MNEPQNSRSHASLARKRRIDARCIEFEDALLAETHPAIEAYLERSEPGDRAELLRELLLIELDYRRRQGIDSKPDDYVGRFEGLQAIIDDAFSDRSSPLPHRSYEPGDCIGKYTIVEPLGRGAFAAVYLAEDTSTHERFALKVPLLAGQPSGTLGVEWRTLAELRHPAIVRLLDVIEDPAGAPVIVMEYVAGQTLDELLKQGLLPPSEAVRLLIPVAEAIDAAHRAGFVHRDIHSRNVLIDEAGNSHVADFGLAIHESQQPESAGELAGSMSYMSPEQVRGESHWLDGRADIWALGVLLYEMLTGRRPFQATSEDQLAQEILCRDPKPLRQIDRRISIKLEQVCLKCLSKSPADRYTTAADLASDLRAATAPPPLQTGYGRAMAALLAVCLLGVVAWLLVKYIDSTGQVAGTGIARESVPEFVIDDQLPRDFELSAAIAGHLPDKDGVYVLQSGTQIRLQVAASADCYISVWGHEPEVTRLYPRRGQESLSQAMVGSGESRLIPDPQANAFRVDTSAGIEQVVVIGTKETPKEVAGEADGPFLRYGTPSQKQRLRAITRDAPMSFAVLKYRVIGPAIAAPVESPSATPAADEQAASGSQLRSGSKNRSAKPSAPAPSAVISLLPSDTASNAPVVSLPAKVPARDKSFSEHGLPTDLSQAIERALAPDEAILKQRIAKLTAEYAAGDWTVLHPTLFESRAGATGQMLDDGSVLVTGPRGDTDVYRLQFKLPTSQMKALRLETLPDENLPAAGSGRGHDGSFALTEVYVQAGTYQTPPRGRLVRLDLPGNKKYLGLTEVEVFNNGANIAPTGTAVQSSTFSDKSPAVLALDGDYGESGIGATSTAEESEPWWEVDLGDALTIDRIVVWNYLYERHLLHRLNGVVVSILDEDRHSQWSQSVVNGAMRRLEFNLNGLRPVELSRAAATGASAAPPGSPYRSSGADTAIDGDQLGSEWGWSAAPQSTQVIAFNIDLPGTDATDLILDLHQDAGQGQLLGRFRISTSAASDRVYPELVAAALETDPDARSQAQWRVLLDYVGEDDRPPNDRRADAAWARKQLQPRIQHAVQVEKFDEAVRSCELLLQVEESVPSGLGVAEVSLRLASLYEAAGHDDDSERTLSKLIDEAERFQIATHPLVHEAELRLSDDRLTVADPARAEQLRAATRDVLRAQELLQEDPADAVELAKQALDVRLAAFGAQHHLVGQAQLQLAAGLVSLRQYGEAKPPLLAAIGILDTAYRTHRHAAEARQLLATCYGNLQEEFATTFALHLRAIEIFKESLGTDHIVTAEAQMKLTSAWNNQHEYQVTIDECQQAIEFMTRERHRYFDKLVDGWYQLGVVFESRGMGYEATVVLEKARLSFQQLGNQTREAETLHMLGRSYYWLNRGFEARRDWEAALAMAESQNVTRLIAMCCADAGLFHLRRGQFVTAKPLLKRAYELRDRLDSDALKAFVVQGWGESLYDAPDSESRTTDPIPILAEAARLSERAFGRQSAAFSTALASLAQARARAGDLASARRELEEAFAITKAVVGPESPNYVSQATWLADILRKYGEPKEAKEVLLQAQQAALPFFHRGSEEWLRINDALGRTYAMLGEYSEAVACFQVSLDTRLEAFRIDLPSMSEAEAVTYQQFTLDTFDRWLVAARSNSEPGIEAYRNLWRIRGLVSLEQTRRRQACRHDPSLKNLYDELQQTRREMSALGNGLDNLADEQQLQTLNNRKEALERKIADKPPEFVGDELASSRFDIQDIVSILPADSAIIEFVRYDAAAIEVGKSVDLCYDAFVVRQDDSADGFSVEWVQLGAAAEVVSAHVRDWRLALTPDEQTRGIARPGARAAEPDQTLYELIWKPLEAHFVGCDFLVIVPDGDLCWLPWLALPGRAPNRYLIEDSAVITANHAAKLYELVKREPSVNRQLLVVGGVDYGQVALGSNPSLDVGEASPSWQTLPTALREAEGIRDYWPDASHRHLLSGTRATEEQVRALMPSQRVVHLATHGQFQHAGNPDQIVQANQRHAINARNPLLQPRIILAGANRADLSGGLDGVLTAEELVDLELSGVDLMILSACETGLGSVVPREGVFDLRRALHLAGARSVVASLWKVDDEATSALMVEFHRNLWQRKLGTLGALRAAQLSLLHGDIYPVAGDVISPTPPQLWAAWMLSGDWE